MKICSSCRQCYEDAVLSCIEENHNSLIAARPGGREIITDYRLDFLLECDAISETYSATNISLDQPCAVKTIDANLIGISHQLREQFRDEARTAMAVDHPNVIRVYESGILESNELYVVTESVEGQTLREYSNSVGSPSEKNAVTIARQTAEGLEAAHTAGAQHRNLNPTNIILTSSSENGLSVKIQNFDFGNVRGAAASAVSDSESHLNWLRYSSPEQCAAETTDARTDIYSLGVVLYEMLEGRPPFDAPDAAEIIGKQINEQPPPVKISNFDIRALLTHTLTQALRKNPTRRLQTANAFARQLRHIEQLITRSPIPVPAFERIPAPNTTPNSVRITENNPFAAKSGKSFFEETQPPDRETAETVTVNPAQVERVDLQKETVREDRAVEIVSPVQPEVIFVKREKAVDYQLASEFNSAESEAAEDVSSERETIQAKRQEFNYAQFASESLRFKDEFAVDPSEPESFISPAASAEETSAQPPAKANLLPSSNGGRKLRQSRLLNRPILAGAWLAALLVSAIIGILLSEKFQPSAAQPPTVAAPVPESASIAPVPESAPMPKSEEPTLTASGNTAITEEPETEETDASDLEKYTPVKFEKPEPPTPFRGGKSQPPKEEAANKTKAKQNTSPDRNLVSEEKADNKIKAKQTTSPNKKLASKKQISPPTEPDIFKRPRIVEGGGVRGKN